MGSDKKATIEIPRDAILKAIGVLLLAIGAMVGWEIRELREEIVELRLLCIQALAGVEIVAGGDPSTVERSDEVGR